MQDLLEVFPDPRDAFICCPNRITLRRLGNLYGHSLEESDQIELHSELRRRCRQERWLEQRAVFQARRAAARRDAIIESEAQVWAVLGLDFHTERIRSMWQRWEDLSEYVDTQLAHCSAGNTPFTPALKDACKELRDIEDKLEELMPKLGVPEAAQRAWTERAGSREAMINEAERKLASVAGGDRGAQVFELLEGGLEDSQDAADEQ